MTKLRLAVVNRKRSRVWPGRAGGGRSRRVEAVNGGIAVVTGASTGIGAAIARALAEAGFSVVLGARRLDRLQEVAAEIGGRALPLDVTDPASVQTFAVQVPNARVLVNNAGGALGRDNVDEADEDAWSWMLDVNYMGTVRMTKALLPALQRSGNGHLVIIGSVAGFETYPAGAGYTAAKHAQRALAKTLRLELLGKPVRVTEVNPGLVGGTEFSLVRFGGDVERAEKVYEGLTPLTPEDVADCVVWAVTRPAHVNIDEIVVRPLDQATARDFHRRTTE
jgi:NADP-dependent 3-hydroxy acid dehydrogenase YdfG